MYCVFKLDVWTDMSLFGFILTAATKKVVFLFPLA